MDVTLRCVPAPGPILPRQSGKVVQVALATNMACDWCKWDARMTVWLGKGAVLLAAGESNLHWE